VADPDPARPDNAEFRRELDATRAAARRGAQEKLDAARAAQRSGQPARAIQLHVQALALDPASAEAARALRELDRQKYARIQQDRAARAKPMPRRGRPATARSARPTRRRRLRRRAGAGDARRRRPGRGLRDLRAWVAANPRQRATRLRIGAAVFDKGREQEASGAREQALSTYESAVARATRREWAARIAPLKKSVAEELYEAGVRASRSDLKRAIAQWEACLRLDPQHARASARLQEARRLQARVQRIEDGTAPK
jgi:tetratricopeptide (TPR) repeat protein